MKAIVPTEMACPSTWTDRRGRDRTPSIPGHELAGVITALGYGTTGVSVGQRVFGLADWYRDGTLAEYVAIEARNLAPLPGDVDFTVGASLPISGLTAWQGLFEHGCLRAGQSVIAHGAAGAVGSMVTQLARLAGAYVIGTGRAADRQKALDFGANEFVDLDNELLEDVGAVDLVFDLIGGDIGMLGANDYAPAAGSELVVVTAGIARKPGMSRDDLVRTNADIVKQVSLEIKRHCPNAIVVVVSNPLDVMCWVTKQVTGFPRERVIGMAGVLDTARYRSFLAAALEVSVDDIQAMVLGGHGDTMVPLVSYTTVSGIPVSQLLDKATLDKIVERTRNGGAEIVAFLKTGSAYYAPSAAVTQMVEAIAHDKKRILPCAAWVQGEYGVSGIYLGVPCKLGRRGLERILEVTLSPEERAALQQSAAAVKQTMGAVKL